MLHAGLAHALARTKTCSYLPEASEAFGTYPEAAISISPPRLDLAALPLHQLPPPWLCLTIGGVLGKGGFQATAPATPSQRQLLQQLGLHQKLLQRGCQPSPPLQHGAFRSVQGWARTDKKGYSSRQLCNRAQVQQRAGQGGHLRRSGLQAHAKFVLIAVIIWRDNLPLVRATTGAGLLQPQCRPTVVLSGDEAANEPSARSYSDADVALLAAPVTLLCSGPPASLPHSTACIHTSRQGRDDLQADPSSQGNKKHNAAPEQQGCLDAEHGPCGHPSVMLGGPQPFGNVRALRGLLHGHTLQNLPGT